MQYLQEIGLYGKGLVAVSTPMEVLRYNQALEALGLTATQLGTFHVDSWGWSPEIATEKNDDYYLSHGLANPFAIIISPLQEHCVPFRAYHSFDKEMMRQVFVKMQAAIRDLTTRTAIIVECDQQVHQYSKPEDLLAIKFFKLKFSTADNLDKVQLEQGKMERKIYEEEFAWADKSLRDGLRASYRAHGVLSSKKFQLPEQHFDEVANFSTRAFGGAFVYRKVAKLSRPLLVFENEKNSTQGSQFDSFALRDPRLLQFLIYNKIIGVYPEKLKQELEDLERLNFLKVLTAYYASNGQKDISQMHDLELRKTIADLQTVGHLSESYTGLEQMIDALRSGKDFVPESLPHKVYNRLLRPNPALPQKQKWLLWRMMLTLFPFDIFRLYVYHKEVFFEAYKTWPEGKKKWAADYIKKRYKSQKPN